MLHKESATHSIGRHALSALLALGLIVSGGAAAGAEPAPTVYRLAVVPRLPPVTTHRDWTPFMARLAQDTGLSFELRLYRTITQFEAVLARGETEFAYMNPYHQVVARRQQGYLPLVREGRRPLSGVLVVQKDGPIQSLQHLHGKEIAFPHPNAFGASLYMRALLREQHAIEFTPRYLTNHSNVYRHVLLGLASAGGGINVTLNHEPAEVRAGLRVLYETPPAAPHPLSAHPRVPPQVRDSVLRAILAMAGDERGRQLLAAVSLDDPQAADFTRDYAVLERLNLERYYVHTTGGAP